MSKDSLERSYSSSRGLSPDFERFIMSVDQPMRLPTSGMALKGLRSVKVAVKEPVRWGSWARVGKGRQSRATRQSAGRCIRAPVEDVRVERRSRGGGSQGE